MDLVPFDQHPGDPGAIRAAGDDLTAVARTTLDLERVALSVFRPALRSWEGVASEELRAAPAPVRRAGLQSAVRHSWGGAVLGYWAGQISAFNSAVVTVRTMLDLKRQIFFVDQEEALANASREWHRVHDQYIVDGGDRVAQMLAEGPTSANQEFLRQMDLAPAGIDRVFVGLWQELVPPTSDRVTLLNLNIGMGYKDDYGDARGTEPHEIREIAERIVTSGADIATMQEVWGLDWLVGNGEFRGMLEAELERLTGDDWQLHFQRATMTSQDTPFGDRENIPYGNMIAVRYGDGITSSAEVMNERISVEAAEPRRVLGVQVQTEDGGVLNVATTHISTDSQRGSSDEEQARQIEALLGHTTRDSVPTVVTGDFNQTGDPDTEPGIALHNYRDSGLTDVDEGGDVTHSAGRIDHVFTDPGVRGSNVRRIEGDPDGNGRGSDLTDHDGVIVDLEVPADR